MKYKINDSEMVYVCAAVGRSCTALLKEEVKKNIVAYNGIDVDKIDSVNGYSLFEKLRNMAHAKATLESDVGYGVPKVEKIISHAPATIIFWKDGTKTVVKCQNGEPFDAEKGIALCYMKKALGNHFNWYETMKKLMKSIGANTEAPVDTGDTPVV